MGFHVTEKRSNLLLLMLIITIFLVAGTGVSQLNILDFPMGVPTESSFSDGKSRQQNLRDGECDIDNHCTGGLCCSKDGFCGSSDPYCGCGCQSGPCIPCPPPPPPGDSCPQENLTDLVTDEFFNGIINQAADDCPGKGFYTRDAFYEALCPYPEFGTTGTRDDMKREVAAFFAHVSHETGGHMCYIEEINKTESYCNTSYTQYPCVAGKSYYGRGPLQLRWNYNYGPAGQNIGFDGLTHPERVADENVISFKSALWYWIDQLGCHAMMINGKGFGATIRAITGQLLKLECDGVNPGSVADRVGYYKEYCNQLQVSPGDNLSC